MLIDPYAILAEQLVPGATVRARRPLKGGVSASVEMLELGCPDGARRRVVLRRSPIDSWKPHEAGPATQLALHRALGEAGFAVPAPLLADESTSTFPSPYMVMEFVDGTTSIEANHRDDALCQMADFLSRLHTSNFDEVAMPPLPHGDDPVRGILQYLPSTPDTEPLRGVLTTATYEPPPSVLLHGDFWPGNVLWKDGRIAAVLDWEDAALGDPLSDLACARLEIFCAYGRAAMEAFTKRYLASSQLDTSALPLWDVFVASAAMATMKDWGLPPDVEAPRRQESTRFLERASSEIRASSRNAE